MGDDDSADPFREWAAGVTPLKQDRVLPHRPRERTPKPSTDTYHRAVFEAAEYGEQPDSFHRGGLQRTLLRRFRRGDIRPESRLDLHGYRRDRAQRTLEAFIEHAAKQQYRCVLIIHGKGSRSADRQAVLRQMVRAVLVVHDTVIAYTPAMPNDGGDGAMYVYLKRESHPLDHWQGRSAGR